MNKIIHVVIIILLSVFLGKAQNNNYPVMYSNEEDISFFVNGVEKSCIQMLNLPFPLFSGGGQ